MTLLITLALFPAPGATAAPEESTPQLLVAVLKRGGYYPPDPACSKPNVWCMNVDYWLKAEVLSTLSGSPAPAILEISASDHYGPSQYLLDDGASLLLVRRDGKRGLVLGKRPARLVPGKSGELFLIRWGASYPGWLPCGVDAAQQELAESEFDTDELTIKPEDFADAGVDEFPERFRPTARGAMPRYGIRMQRLAAHIGERARAGLPFTCEATAPH